MIDTHTHLNLSPLVEDAEAVWQRAQEAGVKNAIIIGTDIRSSQIAVRLAQNLSGTYGAVGIHPDSSFPEGKSTTDALTQWEQDLETLLAERNVIAIGECGLDYVVLHTLTKEEAVRQKNQQKQLFGLHIKLAKTHNLPLSIHCRNTQRESSPTAHELNAYTDLIDTMEHFSKDDGVLPKFVLHCMSGDHEYLRAGLHRGGYISFAGNVTYKSADSLRALLTETPLNRLLLETDAPFLSPNTSRGTVNEPTKIVETYQFVAQFLHISLRELQDKVTANTHVLFGI